MSRLQRREWRPLVLGHPELTPAQKLVLLALETFADYPEGTNARPGVTLLARTCRLGQRVVEGALAQGRRLDLIEQTQRANPKRGLAASYRLISTRTSVQVEPGSARTSVRVEGAFQPAQNEFQPARNGFSTRTSVQPTKGEHQGRTPRGGALDDEPRCSEHADPHRFPTPPNCIPCKQIRKQREQEQHMTTQHKKDDRELLKRARLECAACKGTGHIDITDNSVARCPDCSTPAARQRIINGHLV